MSFNGKIVIITGGTGALGSVIAEVFLERGASVAIPYHSSLPRDKSVIMQDRVLLAKADLLDESDAGTFAAKVVERFGTVDFLINSAGGYSGGSLIEDVGVEEWDSMMDMNAKSCFLMCRAVLPYMKKKQSGRIVNIAAMPALSPGAKKGPYQISKRALITLTETIALETKGTGITANAIAPSIILTEANRSSMPDADSSKWVTPQEIAELILYLCSDHASAISGNTIKIYGGV
jgi:NAD(P)-dependent dehydrogenase (short-subunit alcohol dehydrogenase family)